MHDQEMNIFLSISPSLASPVFSRSFPRSLVLALKHSLFTRRLPSCVAVDEHCCCCALRRVRSLAPVTRCCCCCCHVRRLRADAGCSVCVCVARLVFGCRTRASGARERCSRSLIQAHQLSLNPAAAAAASPACVCVCVCNPFMSRPPPRTHIHLLRLRMCQSKKK